MKIFKKLKDLFKFKKPEKIKKPRKKIVKKPAQKPKKKEVSVEPKPIKKPKVVKRIPTELSEIILAPQITEKTTDLSTENKYVFKVSSRANKSQIKRAIRALYGVKVVGVAIINIHRKTRKIGRTSGFKPGYKKAIVTLASGQKIEIVKGV